MSQVFMSKLLFYFCHRDFFCSYLDQNNIWLLEITALNQ